MTAAEQKLDQVCELLGPKLGDVYGAVRNAVSPTVTPRFEKPFMLLDDTEYRLALAKLKQCGNCGCATAPRNNVDR